MSAAIFHPGDVRDVSPRHLPTRIVCVSSGTSNFDGGISVQPPRSTPSRRIIQRRNKFMRLHAEPVDGFAKKYDLPARAENASIAGARSSCSALKPLAKQ